LVWPGQKIGNNIFQTGQIQNLQIKFWNECQVALLSGLNGGLKHEKLQWQVVCDLSKVEMLDLRKNCRNV
jgi:hypothetical protein